MALILNPKSSTRNAAMTTATINADWAKKKARWMLEREIHLISTRAVPSAEAARAMVEAYTVVSLLDDQQHDDFIRLAEDAARKRKRQLTASRVNRLLEEIRNDDQTCAIAR
ncbi:hypothetical protein ACYCAX_11590 [Pseudomonas sp. MT3]